MPRTHRPDAAPSTRSRRSPRRHAGRPCDAGSPPCGPATLEQLAGDLVETRRRRARPTPRTEAGHVARLRVVANGSDEHARAARAVVGDPGQGLVHGERIGRHANRSLRDHVNHSRNRVREVPVTTKLLISVAMAASMTAWTTAPGTSISSSVSPGETSLSPDGNRVLAQWSGECEVPLAYLATLQSGPPVPITGATTDAPESFALGWTRGDRALVLLPEGFVWTRDLEARRVCVRRARLGLADRDRAVDRARPDVGKSLSGEPPYPGGMDFPFGSGDPDAFADAPLFRELQRVMSSSSGPVNWEMARQIGIANAQEGRDDPAPAGGPTAVRGGRARRRAARRAVHRPGGAHRRRRDQARAPRRLGERQHPGPARAARARRAEDRRGDERGDP